MRRAANVTEMVAFITTVEAGGFARAATRLGRSRSAIAKSVARLEERLETRLLSRNTRHVTPTAEGERFYARCAAILEQLDGAEAELSEGGGQPAGVLRITAPDAYGRLRLLPLVRRFLERWPAVQVELSLSDRLSGIVEEGVDLAIRLGQPDLLPPDLVTRVLGRCRLGFFASPEYLAARGRPETLEALRTHDCIPYDVGSRRRRWRALGTDGIWNTLPGHARLSVDSGDAMLRAALLGLGIAYMPAFLVGEPVAVGTLEEVLVDCATAELPIVAIYPSRRHLPTKVRAFLDLLVEEGSRPPAAP